LPDNLPIQNGLKQGDALSPLIFKFVFEYAIRKVQENQVGLILNEAHQLLVYADDVNLLGDSIGQTQTLTDASKEVGIEVNTEKTKYMLLSHHQNTGLFARKLMATVFCNRKGMMIVEFMQQGTTITQVYCKTVKKNRPV
jgi:hypothetical protein